MHGSLLLAHESWRCFRTIEVKSREDQDILLVKFMNACALGFTFVCAEALRASIKQRWTSISHNTFRHRRVRFIASAEQPFSKQLHLYIREEIAVCHNVFCGSHQSCTEAVKFLNYVFPLRWLTTVFWRLVARAMIACQMSVLIARAQITQATLRRNENHFSTWKALNHFSIHSNSFKLRSNMCLIIIINNNNI